MNAFLCAMAGWWLRTMLFFTVGASTLIIAVVQAGH